MLHLGENNPYRHFPLFYMIQDILETGKDIYRLSVTLRSKKEEHRYRLANLLELIGHLVKDTAVSLRSGQLPACKSQQLELLSEELYFRLSFSVGEIKARTLSSKLKRGYLAGRIQIELNESQSTHHHLMLLEDAAGYFLATSEKLRMVELLH